MKKVLLQTGTIQKNINFVDDEVAHTFLRSIHAAIELQLVSLGCVPFATSACHRQLILNWVSSCIASSTRIHIVFFRFDGKLCHVNTCRKKGETLRVSHDFSPIAL